MAKTKRLPTLWEVTDAKTGRQITLWIITIVLMVLFSNNVIQFWFNFINNPGIVGLLNLLTFFTFRIVLGYLFDEKPRRRKG